MNRPESVEELERWLRRAEYDASEELRRASLTDRHDDAKWCDGYKTAMRVVADSTDLINHVGFGVDVAGLCDDCNERDAELCYICAALA